MSDRNNEPNINHPLTNYSIIHHNLNHELSILTRDYKKWNIKSTSLKKAPYMVSPTYNSYSISWEYDQSRKKLKYYPDTSRLKSRRNMKLIISALCI